jgi:hypothetical protein
MPGFAFDYYVELALRGCKSNVQICKIECSEFQMEYMCGPFWVLGVSVISLCPLPSISLGCFCFIFVPFTVNFTWVFLSHLCGLCNQSCFLHHGHKNLIRENKLSMQFQFLSFFHHSFGAHEFITLWFLLTLFGDWGNTRWPCLCGSICISPVMKQPQNCKCSSHHPLHNCLAHASFKQRFLYENEVRIKRTKKWFILEGHKNHLYNLSKKCRLWFYKLH